jgi:hypothetical protein
MSAFATWDGVADEAVEGTEMAMGDKATSPDAGRLVLRKLWDMAGAVVTLSREHPRRIGWHGTSGRHPTEPAVAVAGDDAVSRMTQQGRKEPEKPSGSCASDDIERRADGGFPFESALCGPQDDRFQVLRQGLSVAHRMRRRAVKWGEFQSSLTRAFPFQQSAHGTVAQGTSAIEKQNGGVRVRSHRRQSSLLLGCG